MNIFIASLLFPFPCDNGGSAGTFKMIDFLRKTVKIDLLLPFSNQEDLESLRLLWPDVNIYTFDPPTLEPPSFVQKIKKSLKREKTDKETFFKSQMIFKRINLVDYYQRNFIEIAINLFNKNNYDLICTEFIDLAPLIHFIPENSKSIFIHHEIRYKRLELELNTLPAIPLWAKWELNNIKVLELGILEKFSKVLCLTPDDKKILVSDGLDSIKVEISPLAANISDHAINIPFNFKNKIVFLGPDNHFPNLDAVDWFLTHCWMSLRRQHPDLRFEVIGKWTKQSRSFYSQMPGVYFHGFVENLEEVMEGAIMVVPLRIGSGMRMKILEGASWHMPIVSTTIGAEGLPMQNEYNCFLADSPEDFVEAISRLIASPELQTKFIEKSSDILKADFSVEECGKRRLEIFEQLVATHAS